MNYQELLNDLWLMTGDIDPLGSIDAPDMKTYRLMAWIEQTWLDIQREHDWHFMWDRGQFYTVEQSGVWSKDYKVSVAHHFNTNSFTAFDTTEHAEFRISFEDYPTYRGATDLGVAVSGPPQKVTILPDKTLRLHPRPDKAYAIQFDYYKNPQVLHDPEDVPIFHDDYHRLITFGAMQRYGAFYEKPTIESEGKRQYDVMFAHLVKEET